MGSATARTAARIEAPRARIPHAFEVTDAFSLGAEEEFMLVHPGTGMLAANADAVVRRCAQDASGLGAVDHEVVQTVVETGTPVCATAPQVERALAAQRARVGAAARASRCRLVSCGTHPFDASDQPITRGPRYHELARRYPWVIQEAATYGMHVHVGVRGADRAVATANLLREVLPHLLALSANSPWWRGEATGLASTRLQLSRLFPRSGMPPTFRSWAHFERTIETLQASDVVDDYTHTWWYVRPHPRYGTVEVRICDAQTRVEHSAALAALVQALVAWIGDRIDAGERADDEVTAIIAEENVWSAARYGTSGRFIDTDGSSVFARDALHRLLVDVSPWMGELGSLHYLATLHALAERNGAERQRAAASEAGLELLDELVAATVPSVASVA